MTVVYIFNFSNDNYVPRVNFNNLQFSSDEEDNIKDNKKETKQMRNTKKGTNRKIFQNCTPMRSLTEGTKDHKEEKFIYKICKTRGSSDGGDEVTLLTKYSSSSLRVRIFETDQGNETIWEAYAKIRDIFKSSITFQTPKYGGPWLDENIPEIPCLVELICAKCEERSNSVEYIYENHDAIPCAKKRRRMSPPEEEVTIKTAKTYIKQTESEDRFKPKSTEMAFKTIKIALEKYSGRENEVFESTLVLENIEKLNNAFSDQHMHGNTIFHEAIANGHFLKLCKLINKFKLKSLLRKAINDHGEMLLHFACKLNKSDYISPLISSGCEIATQDYNGKTPMHIAIQKQHSDCIKKFQELFKHPLSYSKMKEELKELYEIYNRQGHTVLHLAILHDLRELVTEMLKFALEEKIDVCAIEVLGNGNTILHLAVSEGLLEMRTLILELIPDADQYTNYEGKTAFNMTIY